MVKAADISTKRLISLAPENWVKWVTQIPDIVCGEILNSEFQWISRESDVLVRATSPKYGEFLVLNELQLRYKPEMPKRMRAYTALAEEKYNLPTYPVLVNILKESDVEIPTSYESQFAGLQARQDYRVINLWQVDVEIVFTQPVPCLLPFVPILKGGAEESTVQRALQILRADEQLSQLEIVMAFFATFVLDSALVQQIMRWDMAVLRESPWYQQIFREGEQRGRQEEMLLGIELALEIKFGVEGLQVMPEISQISDLDRLKAIQQVIKSVNTLDELRELI
ncbi:Rpn family recombination-promoting nuclease/putative transposase [Nostoc sp. WHI]|uniref:Rpn family recombination-promoting nuclease/putative transposase n=1 Tax=Nostoc sp. WHI TaxID=2650611 RepID=UPI0018C80525|nr:Rpn family recombination-promoting nuclease/putative transposase [Nostoc sp. WHI]MBG1271937.1 Rpn family recombination-promoting nuclease/putative transposase [Nostoc sp. WHI]